jgi:RNA polymerase sigma factor (sigma-70 family)
MDNRVWSSKEGPNRAPPGVMHAVHSKPTRDNAKNQLLFPNRLDMALPLAPGASRVLKASIHLSGGAGTFQAEDAALVARCRNGDGAAWGELVQRFQRLVYTVVTRAGLDEHTAADVFQTVFERLLAHLPKLAQPERIQAWVVTTAKREALRVRHLGQRNVSMTRADDASGDGIEDTLADDAPLAEDVLDELQQLDLLRHGMDRLDARCRDLLTLVFRDEDEPLGYVEVARQLVMPIGSIGPTRTRCVEKLRRLVLGPSKNA